MTVRDDVSLELIQGLLDPCRA